MSTLYSQADPAPVADVPLEVPASKPMVRSEPKSPMDLMAILVERGADADQLGKMLDLQERWAKARAIEAYNAAMSVCQAEMPVIVADAKNNHTKSTYASLEHVNKLIKPVYTRHGFSLSYSTEDCQLPGHFRVACTCRHKDGHETVHRLDLPLDGKGSQGNSSAMNVVQAAGSTISYGRRYIALMIFNITIADEDDDGQGPKLTPSQIQEINVLIDQIRDAGGTLDFKKFLSWLKVEALDDVPQTCFQLAIVELSRRLKEAKAKREA